MGVDFRNKPGWRCKDYNVRHGRAGCDSAERGQELKKVKTYQCDVIGCDSEAACALPDNWVVFDFGFDVQEHYCPDCKELAEKSYAQSMTWVSWQLKKLTEGIENDSAERLEELTWRC